VGRRSWRSALAFFTVGATVSHGQKAALVNRDAAHLKLTRKRGREVSMVPKKKSAEGEAPPTAAALMNQVETVDYHRGTKKIQH